MKESEVIRQGGRPNSPKTRMLYTSTPSRISSPFASLNSSSSPHLVQHVEGTLCDVEHHPLAIVSPAIFLGKDLRDSGEERKKAKGREGIASRRRREVMWKLN